MAEQNGTVEGASPGALRTFLGIIADRLGLAARLGSGYDGKRILHDVLGYQKTLRYQDFKARYERGDIAHAIVRAYPDATWSQPPTVREDDQDETQTPFEAAWLSLVERLQVFRYLKRADVLANLGQYAILLIGFRGQALLDVPALAVRSPDDVLYLQPYSEEFATVEQLEENAALATYGQPLLYRLTAGRTVLDRRHASPRSTLVHASRVIHIAEDVLDDEIYGVPRLQPVFDKLDDLLKVAGGGAEGFWRDARRRIATILREGYQLRPEDQAALQQEVEEYAYGFRDFLRLTGMDVQQLNGVVASPKDHVEVLLNLIAGTLRMPKAVLIGAEQGTLASAEEEAQVWKEQVSQRQQQFAEPVLLRPLIDRLLLLRALPAPVQPYQVDWVNLHALSEVQQATVAKDRASAYNQYEAGRVGALNAGLSPTIPPQEFRETVLNLPPESEYALEMPEMFPSDEGQAEDDGRPAEASEEAGVDTATEEDTS